MKALAIRTRSHSADYQWKSSDPSMGSWYEVPASFCGEGPSYSASAGGGAENRMSLFVGGLDGGTADPWGRPIGVDLAINGLTDSDARKILCEAMKNGNGFQERLLKGISRPDAKMWQVDFDRLRELIDECTQGQPETSLPPPFTIAWERTYTTDSKDSMAASLRKLASELEQHSFSPGNGLKLLVSAAPQEEGYARAVKEADRLLWQTDQERNLSTYRKSKPPVGKNTQPPSNPLGDLTTTAGEIFAKVKQKAKDHHEKRKKPPNPNTPDAPDVPQPPGVPETPPLPLETPPEPEREPSDPVIGPRSPRRQLTRNAVIVAAIFALGMIIGSIWRGASAKKERQQAVEEARKEKDREWEAENVKNVEELR